MKPKMIPGGAILSDGSTVAENDWRAVEAANILRLQHFGEEDPFGSNKNDIDDSRVGSASYARTMEGALANSLSPTNQPPAKSPVFGFAESNRSMPHMQALRKLKSYAENAPDDDQTAKELSNVFARMNGEDLRSACMELGVGGNQITRQELCAAIAAAILKEESRDEPDALEQDREREYQQP